MGFFELPPPQPEPLEPEDLEQPEWLAAPSNVLGAAVPIRLVLARTNDVVIAVTDATAYPTGFEFKLAVRSRRPADEFDPVDFHEPFMWRYGRQREGRELPPEFLRFGIEFADGSKATNVGSPFADEREKPEGPLLTPGGGGGGGGSWDSEYWVWPLPPAGPLAFVCEWPAKGIRLTREEVDAGLVREAAEHAEVLWETPARRAGYWGSSPRMLFSESHTREDDPERP